MLKGKNAIITGSNRGIGKAIVEAYAKNGANIWACARKENPDFEREMKELSEKYHVWIKPIYFEMSDEEQIKGGVKRILAEKQNIDILVNNAGIIKRIPMCDMTAREIYETDVFGPMLLTQLILKKMTRQKQGNIINMSSAAALGANPGNSVYGSAKAALTHWTEILATEVTQNGIRVNAIAPGNIETDILSAHREDARTELEAASLMGRLGKPEEIAEVAVFLASDMSSFVNAQVISVNGGAS